MNGSIDWQDHRNHTTRTLLEWITGTFAIFFLTGIMLSAPAIYIIGTTLFGLYR